LPADLLRPGAGVGGRHRDHRHLDGGHQVHADVEERDDADEHQRPERAERQDVVVDEEPDEPRHRRSASPTTVTRLPAIRSAGSGSTTSSPSATPSTTARPEPSASTTTRRSRATPSSTTSMRASPAT